MAEYCRCLLLELFYGQIKLKLIKWKMFLSVSSFALFNIWLIKVSDSYNQPFVKVSNLRKIQNVSLTDRKEKLGLYNLFFLELPLLLMPDSRYCDVILGRTFPSLIFAEVGMFYKMADYGYDTLMDKSRLGQNVQYRMVILVKLRKTQFSIYLYNVPQ